MTEHKKYWAELKKLTESCLCPREHYDDFSEKQNSKYIMSRIMKS